MGEIWSNKDHKTNEQFPGRLGGMANLFDLSAGLSSGNKLLTDKPHHDSSPLRSRSDAVRIQGTTSGNKLEDKMVYPDLLSLPKRNTHSTPMKLPTAREMSEEIKSEQGRPNVVAKLMGLDAFPQQQHNVVMKKSSSKDCSRHTSCHSGEPAKYWTKERDFLDEQMKWQARGYEDYCDYGDVYEIQKEFRKTNSLSEKSPQRGICSDRETNKKKELVHQKFMTVKHLATMERLSHSKEFPDAFKVLSSNEEIFLDFLQDRNSLIVNPYDMHSAVPPPETNRITVLRPSKMADLEKFPARAKKKDNPIKSLTPVVHETYLSYDVDECADRATRIVVLKPNAGKMCKIKSSISVSSTSPRTSHGENRYFETEDYRVPESREMDKEIARPMHRKLMGDRRDEALMSSAFRGKTSFGQSGNQYTPETCDDSEVMSLNSRHSWDCINGSGSPMSSSSFSRASYSPDLSIYIEAKKHLSERLSMMASSGGSQEERRGPRSSNMLSEMLALSDAKSSIIKNEEGNGREEAYTVSILDKGDAIDMSVNLQKSKTLSASSTEVTRKRAALSFKGKVSSFFFPRNKRSSKDNCTPRSTEEYKAVASGAQESSMSVYPHNQSGEDSQLDECLSPNLDFPSKSFSDSTMLQQKRGMVPLQEELPHLKPAISGKSTESADQPSPTTVLELPYEEDDTASSESSVKQLPVHGMMSNRVNKSPSIGSIARTLSWDDSCSGSGSPSPRETASHELVEQDWLLLVRKILSSAGLDEETQWDTLSFNRHCLENPLDPSLRHKLMSTDKEYELLHEAERTQRRSNLKLVFDCVNEALAQITSCEIETTGLRGSILLSGNTQVSVLDQVWAIVKGLLSREVARDEWDGLSAAVEVAVREEVVAGRWRWWAENLSLEMGDFGKEIEQGLLQELVDEALVDLL